MKYILTRADKNGEWKDCRCSLYIGSNRNFTIYFDNITPEIGLNDDNYHSVTKLEGVVNNLIVCEEGITLEVFLKIGNKWHLDGFTLKFDGK